MRRVLLYLVALQASGFAMQVAAQAPLTISFANHDFGRIAVAVTSLKQFWVGGASMGDSVVASLEGPDAADWVFNVSNNSFGGTRISNPCADRGRIADTTCTAWAVFLPQSPGRKQAVLRVTDARGRSATANLTGTAVIPLCTMTVVPCNYAHLYDGTFSWSINLRGQYSSEELSVMVSIVGGRANCNGSQATRRPDGFSWTGTIVGPGLLGVEFILDSTDSLAYRITAACPSARFPDHADGSQGRASEPAELGSSYSFETDLQRARGAGQAIAGTLNYPAPETDALNGVSGAVAVQWNLWGTGQPQPPPPSAPQRSP
jgi:hypothetical protein